MPLIPKVGLTRGQNIVVLAAFYSLLLVGSVTMVVPFLMTLTSSVANQYDLPQYNIIPRFLHDDEALFVKYLFRKYHDYTTIKDLYRISKADTLTDFSEAQAPAGSDRETRTIDVAGVAVVVSVGRYAKTMADTVCRGEVSCDRAGERAGGDFPCP